ncbi:MAG: long-chain fatty acid--CoA ligase [Gammaproteobacteria bacterium]|nr:MAG: long-chain fatty acid--CoA ligase [Gammaproteobacteria bacterium]
MTESGWAPGRAAAPAICAVDGELSFGQLREAAACAAGVLLAGTADLAGGRVCFLVPPSAAYVVTLHGIFRAGGIAVPLGLMHPEPELAWILDDTRPSVVVAHPDHVARLAPLAHARGLRLLTTSELSGPAPAALPEVGPDRGALIVYTSGTTGRPKGVLSTHAILGAQIRAIVAAWELGPRDRMLNTLPLHHIHGIVNAMCAPLAAGACCEILPQFEAAAVWRRITDSPELTLFTGVPTMYTRLIAAWEAAGPAERMALSAGARRLRLMLSGSAALPVSVLERFREISGHLLLERYGMTEMCMALGNPLHGERRPGTVGQAFPDVEARRVGDDGSLVDADDERPGELQVRGPNVFREYWGQPEATRAAFTADGWFRTGDIAVLERGYYRLLGRASVDIIKTGGYKVSAVEIEEVLREHPAIAEVAVVGVPDPEWGERVAAAVILRPGQLLDAETLRAWGRERLAPYKLPSLVELVSELPRNSMGKVQKPAVRGLWPGASTATLAAR